MLAVGGDKCGLRLPHMPRHTEENGPNQHRAACTITCLHAYMLTCFRCRRHLWCLSRSNSTTCVQQRQAYRRIPHTCTRRVCRHRRRETLIRTTTTAVNESERERPKSRRAEVVRLLASSEGGACKRKTEGAACKRKAVVHRRPSSP